MVCLMYTSMSFSSVFSRKEATLIGLKSLGLTCEAFPALGINITLTSFHVVGIRPVIKQQEKMVCSQGKISECVCCNCAGMILQDPLIYRA